MNERRIELKLSESDASTAYLYLPDHPRSGLAGVVAKQVRLIDLYPGYNGPDVYLDFSKDNFLIAIEVLS